MYQVRCQSGWSRFFDSLHEARTWADRYVTGFYTIMRVGA